MVARRENLPWSETGTGDLSAANRGTGEDGENNEKTDLALFVVG